MGHPEIEKSLPHDDYLERAILGAIISEHPQASELADTLQLDDFFDLRHQKILAQILRLREKGEPVGLLSVHDGLSQAGQLEAAGNSGYVAGLVDGVPRGSQMTASAESLRDMAIRYRSAGPIHRRIPRRGACRAHSRDRNWQEFGSWPNSCTRLPRWLLCPFLFWGNECHSSRGAGALASGKRSSAQDAPQRFINGK